MRARSRDSSVRAGSLDLVRVERPANGPTGAFVAIGVVAGLFSSFPMMLNAAHTCNSIDSLPDAFTLNNFCESDNVMPADVEPQKSRVVLNDSHASIVKNMGLMVSRLLTMVRFSRHFTIHDPDCAPTSIRTFISVFWSVNSRLWCSINRRRCLSIKKISTRRTFSSALTPVSSIAKITQSHTLGRPGTVGICEIKWNFSNGDFQDFY